MPHNTRLPDQSSFAVWRTNKHRASVVQLTGRQSWYRERQWFESNCSVIEVLPSSRLSNKIWSLFLCIPQNLLMRQNPFNSCPNCQSYGYNCVCICQCVCVCVCVCVDGLRAVFPFCEVEVEEKQFPLEEKSYQRDQKTENMEL